MGFKADGVNMAEIRETALGSLGGGQPRSIRRRGYHRALKRKETWAVAEQTYESMIKDLWADLYSDLIYKPNPFLGLSKWLPSTYEKDFFSTDRSTVPLRFGIFPKKSLWSKIKSFFIR